MFNPAVRRRDSCTAPSPHGLGAVHENRVETQQRTYPLVKPPMDKYVAENAKLDVVEVLPLMRILLADEWDPSTGEMLVYCL